MLAEGRAAVCKRRANGRRNRSVNDGSIATFDPRDHVKYLNELSLIATPQERPIAQDTGSGHGRCPSDPTNRSTGCTVVPQSHAGHVNAGASPTSSLGDYSANLAQFIKAQLQSIPAYKLCADTAMPVSPLSCPELSFPMPSPRSSTQVGRRPAEAPHVIEIPPVRPPMLSAFSAWSTTDDDTDDETLLRRPVHHGLGRRSLSKDSSYTPSVLGYYETSNTPSFLFTSAPLGPTSNPTMTTGTTHVEQSPSPGSASLRQDDDDDDDRNDRPEYSHDNNNNNNELPSSATSDSQLTSSSAPSYTSSGSNSSYFHCKRAKAIRSSMRDRIVAAVTPPHVPSKMLTTLSPWESRALSKAHYAFMEPQQRIHIDGMSFDMMSSFISAERATPC